MKAAIVAIIFVVTMCASTLGNDVASSLHLSISMVTGEHSRDSNSTTTNLTLSEGTLVYERTYWGAHAGRRTPEKRRYKLTNDDLSRLIALLNQSDLWQTKTISKPPQQKGTSFYFELTIRADLKDKQSSISIDGSCSVSDWQDDPTYQKAVSLIDELYRVMRRTDPGLARPQLIETN